MNLVKISDSVLIDFDKVHKIIDETIDQYCRVFLFCLSDDAYVVDDIKYLEELNEFLKDKTGNELNIFSFKFFKEVISPVFARLFLEEGITLDKKIIAKKNYNSFAYELSKGVEHLRNKLNGKQQEYWFDIIVKAEKTKDQEFYDHLFVISEEMLAISTRYFKPKRLEEL